MRLPSIIAWAATVGVAAGFVLRQGRVQHGRLAGRKWALDTIAGGLIVAGWLCFDRVQLFYGTEARVYAVVQLLSLVGWLFVATIVGGIPIRAGVNLADRSSALMARGGGGPLVGQGRGGPESGWWWVWILWSVLSVLLVYLHLTTAIVVAWQWCTVFAFLLTRTKVESSNGRFRQIVVAIVGASCVALACLPAVMWSRVVWQRREQWASFAGDVSWQASASFFPWLALLVPVGLARLIDYWLHQRSYQRGGLDQNGLARVKMPSAPKALRGVERKTIHWWAMRFSSLTWLWMIATVGPWLTAWLITWLEIAPLMHRRFVIASAVPLIMLAAYQWCAIRNGTLKFVAGLTVILWLLVSQGTIDAWRQGQVVGWQRVEGWRSAIQWLEENIDAEDEVWCASGLIEGEVVPPLADQQNRYLSFPLRGCYPLVGWADSGRRQPAALVNDSRRWPQQWLQLAESRGSQVVSRRKLWIIFRGTSDELTGILSQLDAKKFHVVVTPQPFGRVAIAAVGQN